MKKQQCGLGCGLVSSLVALLLGILLFALAPIVIKLEVMKNMKLVNGTEGFTVWADQRMQAVFMEFWLFDLRNEMEVMKGAKPYVVQKGPYTYREYRWKEQIINNGNGTVSYKNMKSYIFQPNMSLPGGENDTVKTPNIVLATAIAGLKYLPEAVQMAGSLVLALMDETMFPERRVRDVIWGYQDPVLHVAKGIAPGWFNEDVVGVLANKNNTYDGIYTIYTGETNSSLTGIVEKFNGTTSVDYWVTQWANMINGTDGSSTPPYSAMDESATLRMFSTDVCRSVFGTYHGTTSAQGITLYRYTANDDTFANVTAKPSNAEFCTPAGNCLPGGLLNVSNCQIRDGFRVPLIISLPHFFLADKVVQDMVDGLRPRRWEHETIVNLEPYTGTVMEAYRRMQANLYLEKSPFFAQTRNISSMYYPVLWLNESVKIDHKNAEKFKSMLMRPLTAVHVLQVVLVCLGVVLVVVFSALIARYRRKKAEEESRDWEGAPLLGYGYRNT